MFSHQTLKSERPILHVSCPRRAWSNLDLVVFFKSPELRGFSLKAAEALLSQALITDSHNSQPVDSDRQTPPGVAYTLFLPLFNIQPSTHLLWS